MMNLVYDLRALSAEIEATCREIREINKDVNEYMQRGFSAIQIG